MDVLSRSLRGSGGGWVVGNGRGEIWVMSCFDHRQNSFATSCPRLPLIPHPAKFRHHCSFLFILITASTSISDLKTWLIVVFKLFSLPCQRCPSHPVTLLSNSPPPRLPLSQFRQWVARTK